jgi:hypothetical protein
MPTEHAMQPCPSHDLTIRERGARADRAVAIGAFVACLITGFFGTEPAPEAADARAVQHAASVRMAQR